MFGLSPQIIDIDAIVEDYPALVDAFRLKVAANEDRFGKVQLVCLYSRRGVTDDCQHTVLLIPLLWKHGCSALLKEYLFAENTFFPTTISFHGAQSIANIRQRHRPRRGAKGLVTPRGSD